MLKEVSDTFWLLLDAQPARKVCTTSYMREEGWAGRKVCDQGGVHGKRLVRLARGLSSVRDQGLLPIHVR